jgi:hypothetical protein
MKKCLLDKQLLNLHNQGGGFNFLSPNTPSNVEAAPKISGGISDILTSNRAPVRSIPYIPGGGFGFLSPNVQPFKGTVPKMNEGIGNLFSNKSQVGPMPYIEDIVPPPEVTKSEMVETPSGDFSDFLTDIER